MRARGRIDRYTLFIPMNKPALKFPNPPLEALQTTQQRFAMTADRACKYPAEVAPFAALKEDSVEALKELLSLMEPGEATYVVSETPLVLEALSCEGPLGVLQMIYPKDLPLPVAPVEDGIGIEPLSCENAAEMVELTSIAFPGFFRRRTCEMGSYYGIRDGGRLVAMCGERMNIGEFHEISGLCTLPEYRGRGLAAMLMVHLMREHRAAGLRSYLHVSVGNDNAIALYERMGFELRGEFPLMRLTRVG